MRRKLILMGGTFAAAFVAALVVVVATGVGDEVLAPTDDTESTAEPVAGTDGPADFVSFRDTEAGFSLAYPSDWRRLEHPDPQVRLLVTPNRDDSVLVRAVDLEVDGEVTMEDLPAFREYTDRIVQGGEGVEILDEPAAIEVGGLPGLYYVYTFDDDRSGQQGVHSHYFLFDGATVLSIVMQALPAADFADLAPTFKAVIDSFEGSV